MDEEAVPVRDIATREQLGAALTALKRRQRRHDPLAVPSDAAIAKELKIAPATISNYFTGKTLPSDVTTFHALLVKLGASEEELDQFHVARHRLAEASDRERRAAAGSPSNDAAPEVPATAAPLDAPEPDAVPGSSVAPAVPGPDGVAVSLASDTVPGRARAPRWVQAGLAVAAVVLVAAFVLLIPPEADRPADYLELNADELTPKPLPRAAPCEGRRTAGTLFPDAHIGDVYLLVISPTGAPIESDIDIQWGRSHWNETVEVHPGDRTGKCGGTLLIFEKTATGAHEVSVTSTEPVCAYFGTAATRPLPGPAEVTKTKGWRNIS